MATKMKTQPPTTPGQERVLYARLTMNSITRADALARIEEFIDGALPVMMQRRSIARLHDGLMVEAEHGFAVGASLTIRIEHNAAGRLLNPDTIAIEDGDTREVAIPCTVTVGVSWSGTTRSISEATASVAVYQLLISIGAAIEARFGHGVRIVDLERI